MTDDENITRFVESLLAPLKDVGTLLAKAIDDTNARVDNVVERLDDLDARLIARAEGRQP